jgi:hypothetical protein
VTFLAVAMLVSLMAATAASATPTFGPIVIVNRTDFGGEPGIDVDRTGYLYENAPSGAGASWVYRSRGGTSWTRTPGPVAPTGGFDSNGTIDACNKYYMSDLYVGSAAVHFTTNRGQTWTTNPISLAVPAGDRQWIETGPGCSTVYVTWEQVLSGIWIGRSTDGGQTFPTQKNISSPTDLIGNLAVDKRNGTIYQAYAQDGFKLAVSQDGGGSWTTRTVYSAPSNVTLADSFPVVTLDTAGNVYAVWEQDTKSGSSHRFDIYYAYSRDRGRTWSGRRLVESGSSGSNVFPWATGGGPGQLGVVWYRSNSGNHDPNANSGPWYVDFAQSFSATGAGSFRRLRATPVSIHNDAICTKGTDCSGDDRDLLDFFEVALKPDGRAAIAFADDTTHISTGTGNGDPRNAFIQQVGGEAFTGNPAFPTSAAARRSRLRLRVRPRRLRVGRRTRMRFKVWVIRNGRRRAVRGVRIRFRHRRARTNRRGRARMRVRPRHRGRYRVRACKRHYRCARVRVRVLPRR